MEDTTTVRSKSIKSIELVQELEYLGYSIEELEQRLKANGNIKDYAFIVHDKDVDEQGELKAPHVHCDIFFKTPTKVSTIANYLEVKPNYFEFMHGKTQDALLYLVHAKDDLKAKYEPSAVKSTFDYVQWYARKKRTGASNSKSDKELAQEILEKLAVGEYKEYDLYDEAKVPGLIFVKYKRKFLDMVEWYYKSKQGGIRNMDVIFVTGKPGVGKSVYSRELAAGYGYHVYTSSAGKNALDDYKGEECIILDDLRDSSMSVADVCKLFDNYIDSMVSCRYYNKSISNCKLLIINSVVDIVDFYNGLKEKGEKDPITQICRRITLKVKVTELYYEYYLYKKSEDKFVYMRRTPTPKLVQERIQQDINLHGLEIASRMGKLEEVPVEPEQGDIYKGAYYSDGEFRKKVRKSLETLPDDEETPF